MGDPLRGLKWVSKSPAKLAAALNEGGHQVSRMAVVELIGATTTKTGVLSENPIPPRFACWGRIGAS